MSKHIEALKAVAEAAKEYCTALVCSTVMIRAALRAAGMLKEGAR